MGPRTQLLIRLLMMWRESVAIEESTVINGNSRFSKTAKISGFRSIMVFISDVSFSVSQSDVLDNGRLILRRISLYFLCIEIQL